MCTRRQCVHGIVVVFAGLSVYGFMACFIWACIELNAIRVGAYSTQDVKEALAGAETQCTTDPCLSTSALNCSAFVALQLSSPNDWLERQCIAYCDAGQCLPHQQLRCNNDCTNVWTGWFYRRDNVDDNFDRHKRRLAWLGGAMSVASVIICMVEVFGKQCDAWRDRSIEPVRLPQADIRANHHKAALPYQAALEGTLSSQSTRSNRMDDVEGAALPYQAALEGSLSSQSTRSNLMDDVEGAPPPGGPPLQ